jgi:predicted dehydrogenase
MALRVAIVGCGKIADGHVEEIQKMEVAEVVGVCDLERLMAEQIAARYGIAEYFDDLATMLRQSKPDVVHITTPPQSHQAIAMQAIDAGCHVYVEKPLTVNLKQAEELIRYTKAKERKLTIGHTFQFDPPALKMRELIEEGVLGDPVHVESFLGYDLSGQFGQALLGNKDHWIHNLPGTLFQNNLNHVFNKIAEFVTDDSPEVHVVSFKRRKNVYGDRRDAMPDELRVIIKGEDTSAYATFSSHIRPAGQFARVYGTKSTLHVDYIARTVTIEKGPTLPSAIGRLMAGFDQSKQYSREARRNVFRFVKSDYHFFSGLNQLITLFYNSILHNAPVPIPYRDILRVTAMMDEIIRQMKEEKVTT